VAVYEGARPQSIFLPRRRPRVIEAPTLPRRRMRGAVRARRRTNRLSLLLGGIVVAFMLAFFSLADQQQTLLDRKQELLSDLNRLGSEPAIRAQALDAGLGQLTDPLVLTGN